MTEQKAPTETFGDGNDLYYEDDINPSTETLNAISAYYLKQAPDEGPLQQCMACIFASPSFTRAWLITQIREDEHKNKEKKNNQGA
jgi:hypothetical protein